MVVLKALSLNPQPEVKALLDRSPSDTGSRQRRKRPRVVVTQRRLTELEILDLVAMYEDGASVPDVVTRFGIHRTTVLRTLERHGVPRRPEIRKLGDDQRAEAAELYASGLSTVKVGAIFSVDAETIRKAFIRAGVQLRPRRGIS